MFYFFSTPYFLREIYKISITVDRCHERIGSNWQGCGGNKGTSSKKKTRVVGSSTSSVVGVALAALEEVMTV